MTAAHRYPLDDLIRAMRVSLSQATQQLGVGGPEYRKYRTHGMTRDVAERKALKVGFHPYEVWPEMVEQDYESHLARKRRYQRAWYANASPEVKERALAAARRYKQESRKALSLYSRRYYEQNRDRIAARQREHYLANRERILARQREYDRANRERLAAKRRARLQQRKEAA